MQKHGQERWSLMHDLPETSILQMDKETSLNISLPFFMGSGLELRELPTCPKIAAVIQKPEETLTDFYERLCEAF
jgi:hypothetical protein